MTRKKVLANAIDNCRKELYSLAQPKVSWEEFIEENKIYNKKYKEWEENRENHPEWEGKSIVECIGPRPYEFYYLPRNVMKEICDSYVSAYKMDGQQELLDTIEVLKNYCEEPIVDKYIEDYTDEYGNHHPGYRSYDHPDNLEKEIEKILGDVAIDNTYYQHAILNKFFEFLDMAGEFFCWNKDLAAFNMSVYLGSSPNSNKEAVIKNWKEYKDKEIEIDDYIYKEPDDEYEEWNNN